MAVQHLRATKEVCFHWVCNGLVNNNDVFYIIIVQQDFLILVDVRQNAPVVINNFKGI